jgi:hypothetical protein
MLKTYGDLRAEHEAAMAGESEVLGLALKVEFRMISLLDCTVPKGRDRLTPISRRAYKILD